MDQVILYTFSKNLFLDIIDFDPPWNFILVYNDNTWTFSINGLTKYNKNIYNLDGTSKLVHSIDGDFINRYSKYCKRLNDIILQMYSLNSLERFLDLE